jgi:hypothetical protein
MGPEKTDYPVIALWEARQYLYSRKAVRDEFDRAIGELGYEGTGSVHAIASVRSKLDSDITEAQSVIDQFGQPPHFDPHDWIKVIPLKEVESASFYDPEAYEVWFALSAKPDADQANQANSDVEPERDG